MGKPVIMGRKTFQSLGKPLPGRDNIVVTRDAAFCVDGAVTVRNLDEALAVARRLAAERGLSEIMVIGGAEIYAQALARAARIYLSRVHASPQGDAYFPPLDAAAWRLVDSEPIPTGAADEHAVTLMVYERTAPPSAAVRP
jgi:dihydrofolate reductase